MSEPILKQIHDRFDVYDRYPYTDHSYLAGMGITGYPGGYTVMTLAGGIGSAYDALRIDVRARDNMFGDTLPHRAETSRDNGGLMIMRITQEHDDGRLSGTLDSPAKQEGLSLPGDPGFELFEELHRQLGEYKDHVSTLAGLVDADFTPSWFNFSGRGGSITYDHTAKVETHHCHHQYTFAATGQDGMRSVAALLDGTTQVPFGEELPAEVVYKSGIYSKNAEFGQKEPLEMEALVAFAGLHNQLRKLYTS